MGYNCNEVIYPMILITLSEEKNSKVSSRTKIMILTALCCIIAAASWIMNFGWFRFFMTLFAIPLIHAIIFIVANYFIASYTAQSKLLKWFLLSFCITYLLSYLFLPDAGDIGGSYVFFGLLQNEFAVNISYVITQISFISHIILFILQVIIVISLKRNIKKKRIE